MGEGCLIDSVDIPEGARTVRIGINATFLNETPTGVGIFTREVSRGLCALAPDTRVFTPVPIDALEERFVVRTPSSLRGSIRFADNAMRFVYCNTGLPLLLKREHISVCYCPIMEFPFVGSPSRVVTVHDFHPVYFPKQFGASAVHFRLALRLLPRMASRVVCPSRFVKGEILNHVRMSEDRIDVVPEGFDRSLFSPSPESGRREFQLRHGLHVPFILFVGSLFPYKNFDILLSAFNEIRHRIPHALVIIGKTEVSPNPPLPDERVMLLGYVEPAELVHFYSYADMLVHPSLAEGFGLAVLEAMACGTPVISSSAGSLPEVLGDAGILFDPHDRRALAAAMLTVASDNNRKRKMREDGIRRAERFSWDAAARAVLASCRNALPRNAA